MSEHEPSEGELIAAYAWKQDSSTDLTAVAQATERAINRIKAEAWDEGYEAGGGDAHAFDAVTEGWVDYDEYEDTPNPYRDKP